MPEQDDAPLKQIDVALLRCLREIGRPVTAADLLPCLQQEFPGDDEVEMREGIALTRLRGRTLIDLDDEGNVSLTAEGQAAAANL